MQRVIVDANGGSCFAQFLLAGMGKEHDGFVTVIDAAVSEAGLVVEDETDKILAADVAGGDDGELRPVDAGIKLDGAYETARDRAAHGGSMPHSFTVDVVQIAGAAQQLVDAFLAGDRSSNDTGLGDAGFRARTHVGEGGNPYRLRVRIQRSGMIAKRQEQMGSPVGHHGLEGSELKSSWRVQRAFEKVRARRFQSSLARRTR